MKTMIRLAMIWALAGLTVDTVSAQKVLPMPSQPNHGHGNNGTSTAAAQPKGGNANEKWWISVGGGNGGPHYGPPPAPNYGYYGGSYYGNPGNNNYYGGGNYYGYSYRKAARKTIRNTAYVIFNAIQQASWDGMYNPVLSDAVQHQRYAKYLYNCGDYMGSLYHSRRAGYLAWQSINFNYNMIPNPGYDGWDDDMYGYGGNYNGGGGAYYNDDYYKKNGNGNGAATEPGKQKQPDTDPNAKTPSNEELDKQIQKKNFSKEEMKNLKLSDLDVQ